MGFFNPLLLWFTLGGAIPIIIHLLHRQKYRRIRWAAMEFLLAALKKTRRRLQIENLLLLLVRILLMILLALAISRPFFREAPLEALAESDTLHVLAIDNSYSMGYKKTQDSCFDVAKRTAEKKLDDLKKLTDEDRLCVIRMSSYPDVWIPETNKKELVRQRIGEMRLSHYGTSLYATLQKVREVVDKSKNQQKQVYLFTDLQQNAWEPADDAEAKRFAELTKELSAREDVRISLIDVGSEGADNRAVVDLRLDSPLATVKSSARFTVDLHNWSAVSYPSLAVNLYVDGGLYKTEYLALPAYGTASLSFKYDFLEAGAHYVEVGTEPDYLDLDDRRLLALDVKDGLTCVMVDGEPDSRWGYGETDFLRLMLDLSGLFRIEKMATTEMFDADNLEKLDFVALCNVQSLTQDKVERLERFVRGGGGLFLSLGGKVDRGWYNEFLWKEGKGLLPASLMEVGGSAPDQEPRVTARIQNYRGKHPVFSAFKKGLEKAPRDLVFYQYFRLEKYEPESVIADLDDNFSTPLWLEKAFGEGRVVLFNNTVDGDWNLQVHGRAPYVPMMFKAFEHLAARPSGRRNLFIGDHIAMQMTAERFQKTFVLETPVEGQVSISPESPRGEAATFWVRFPPLPPERSEGPQKVLENQGLEFAGRYVLDMANRREDERPLAYFAVNLPPRVTSTEELHRAEGNLDRISEQEIRRRLPDFKFEMIGQKKGGEAEVDLPPPPAGLWTSLLYMVLGLLVTESVLAWLFGRAKQ